MKVFVSHPAWGLRQKECNAIIKELSTFDYDPRNVEFITPKSKFSSQALEEATKAVMISDLVVFTKGWEKSKYCRSLYSYAEKHHVSRLVQHNDGMSVLTLSEERI